MTYIHVTYMRADPATAITMSILDRHDRIQDLIIWLNREARRVGTSPGNSEGRRVLSGSGLAS
jgi:hypothetical protein